MVAKFLPQKRYRLFLNNILVRCMFKATLLCISEFQFYFAYPLRLYFQREAVAPNDFVSRVQKLSDLLRSLAPYLVVFLFSRPHKSVCVSSTIQSRPLAISS